MSTRSDDMHSIVFKTFRPVLYQTAGVIVDISTEIRDIEADANYANSVTSHYSEVRVDWLKLEWHPCPLQIYNTLLGISPFLTLPYRGPDKPALHGTSQAILAVSEGSVFHDIKNSFTSLWRANKNDPEETSFYSTTGTALNHMIPQLGGIYGITLYTNVALTNGVPLGVVRLSYGLTLRQYRLQ
jgi:hypothetical protein